MYFGTKVVQVALNREQYQNEDDIQIYCRQPPTAPQASSSEPGAETTAASQIGPSNYLSGIVKDNDFYLNNRILNLSNITILNICVCPLSETTEKPYSGKINIMSEKGTVFKQEYNERIRWITLPGDGLDVTKATIKVKVKIGQAVALQYTVVYRERSDVNVVA